MKTISLILFALTSVRAFSAEGSSYSCKAYKNQDPVQRDVRVEISELSCIKSSCTSKTEIYFKGNTIFDGIIALKKSEVSAPDSITTVFSNDHFNPIFGTFFLAHETYLDGRPDFVYGDFRDTTDQDDYVNFVCSIEPEYN